MNRATYKSFCIIIIIITKTSNFKPIGSVVPENYYDKQSPEIIFIYHCYTYFGLLATAGQRINQMCVFKVLQVNMMAHWSFIFVFDNNSGTVLDLISACGYRC